MKKEREREREDEVRMGRKRDRRRTGSYGESERAGRKKTEKRDSEGFSLDAVHITLLENSNTSRSE